MSKDAHGAEPPSSLEDKLNEAEKAADELNRALLDVNEDIRRLFPYVPSEDDLNAFLAAYGSAISSWQLVESALYEVYRAITRSQRPGAEAAAYFAVPAFRTRLNMTSSAVRYALTGKADLIEEWRLILKRAGKKSERRNEMAHGVVWSMWMEPNPERRIHVGRLSEDTRSEINPTKQPPQPLTLTRVRQYEADFRDLSKTLRIFSYKIRQLPA